MNTAFMKQKFSLSYSYRVTFTTFQIPVIIIIIFSFVLGDLELRRQTNELDLKLCHPRCVRSVIQSCSVYIYTVMNTTILQLVAIYNIQLHVSALYVGHHPVVQKTY